MFEGGMLFGMERVLYLKLSALMFLEFAIWGAWYPVLAARLLGPLKFSGKQTGWIYATIPLGCIFMPLVAGQVADQWINAEFILAGAHLLGTLLLFVAAWRKKFGGLFGVMLLYALCYAATLPLVNSVMFHHLGRAFQDAPDVKAAVTAASGKVFIWAPIAWALAGYCLSGWRWIFKTGEQGRDCLVFGALLSVVMAVLCGAWLPETPPPGTSEGGAIQALSMLKESSFLVFILITIVAAGMMQFYFLGTAQFMQDNGIPPKNVPAFMALAQATQAVATGLLLERLLGHGQIGFKWTLTAGAASWLLLYIIYVAPGPRLRIVIAQAFHGLAYVFFIIAGQIFGNSVAPEGTGTSVQGLIFAAQSGLGLFLGTQLAGVVMDIFRTSEGRFRWRGLWFVPGLIMAACVAALVLFFRGTV